MKLEDQLLKLKEEREDLKERGNRHEDKIMRENAKLQVNIALLAITLFLQHYLNTNSSISLFYLPCFSTYLNLTIECNRLFSNIYISQIKGR